MYTEQSLLAAKRNIRWLSFVLADIALIWGAYCFYAFNGWYSSFLRKEALLALYGIAVFYTVVCIINNIRNRDNDEASSPGYNFFSSLRQIITTVSRGRTYSTPMFTSAAQQRYFLFVLVKLFFIPLMIQYTIGNSFELVHEIQRVMKTGMDTTFTMWFNNIVFPLAITLFFLIDTSVYAFGYLFESEKLGNRVRSVDATWSGWIVAIACYSPFIDITGRLAPMYANVYTYFDESITATFILRLMIVLFMSLYAWATLSLGTRASNLTNRGIVTRGAYRFVRHPAYVGKVTAWWVALIPLLPGNPIAVPAMLVWTLLYFLRAVTEERHLSQDPEYVEYCKKVKWRFIPGVY